MDDSKIFIAVHQQLTNKKMLVVTYNLNWCYTCITK
jgi:hypothetical protein